MPTTSQLQPLFHSCPRDSSLFHREIFSEQESSSVTVQCRLPAVVEARRHGRPPSLSPATLAASTGHPLGCAPWLWKAPPLCVTGSFMSAFQLEFRLLGDLPSLPGGRKLGPLVHPTAPCFSHVLPHFVYLQCCLLQVYSLVY